MTVNCGPNSVDGFATVHAELLALSMPNAKCSRFRLEFAGAGIEGHAIEDDHQVLAAAHGEFLEKVVLRCRGGMEIRVDRWWLF